MLLNLSGKLFCLCQQDPILHQISSILSEYHTTVDNFSFYSSGRLLESFENLSGSATILAVVPLKGGKGGYGAKLKTEGGKKVRPNDNMFSRDINGQRISHVIQQKQIRETCTKKYLEDLHVAEERQKCKILQSTLKEGQVFMKLDRAYKKSIENTEKTIGESIMIGREKQKEKERLLKDLEVKAEAKEEAEQEEEGKVEGEEKSMKRPLPAQFKEGVQCSSEKKQKIEAQPTKPSARDFFSKVFKNK